MESSLSLLRVMKSFSMKMELCGVIAMVLSPLDKLEMNYRLSSTIKKLLPCALLKALATSHPLSLNLRVRKQDRNTD